MHPRQDSVRYQKQKYCEHNESDTTIDCKGQTNKQYSEEVHLIKKAHQLSGRTFVVISQEIVDKLCISQDTWFHQDLTSNGIILRILDRNGDGGLS